MIIGFDKEKNEMYIRLGSSCLSQTLKTIGGFKAVWKDISPVYPFEGDFLDKHYESLYQSDIRFMIVILSFSIPAIILSCIGLFGVSLFVTEMRTKKVGIRRVNGATVGEIMTLLNKTYKQNNNCFFNLLPFCILLTFKVAAKLCLQNRIKLVGIRYSRYYSTCSSNIVG